jgi:hypothetical protein
MAMADTLHAVAEQLWVWGGFEPAVKADLHSCAIGTPEGLVVVDPIELTGAALTAFSALGPVVAVVLTNGNHARAALRFRRRFAAPVLAHPGALGELEVPVDGTLTPERLVGGALRVLELPGGGPGEVALYDPREPWGGRLHVGDALIHLESTGFSLLPEKYCSDASLLRRSIRGLEPLPMRLMTFAHGMPLLEDAGGRLRALRCSEAEA